MHKLHVLIVFDHLDHDLEISIQEQRKTWHAYFERQKEEEDEEESTMIAEVSFHSGAGSGANKSPRKSISQAEQKATMKLGLLEQQMTEEKERHEEELDRLKDQGSKYCSDRF